MAALECGLSPAVLPSFRPFRDCLLANKNLAAAAPVNAPTTPAVAIAAKALSAAINLHVLVPSRVAVGKHREDTQKKNMNPFRTALP